MGKQDLAPKAALLFLLTISFSMVSNPLPPLISNCLNLPQGKSSRLNEALFPAIRKQGTLKAFVPRSPKGSCWFQTCKAEPV